MNTKKKVLIFALIIGIFTITTIALPDKEFSNGEKRGLTTLESFENTSIWDGTFQETAKDYIADQFLGREKFVKFYGTVERLMGNKQIEDVYLGDDYLFQEYKNPKDKSIKRMAKSINSFANNNHKINTDILIAPTKVGVLEDSLPAFAPKCNQVENIKKFYDELSRNITKINVADEFLKDNNALENNYYYHSDHHWTSHGAKKAFDIYAKKNHLKNGNNQYEQLIISNDFYGTLAAKTGVYTYPDEITVYLNKNKKDMCKVKYSDLEKKEYTLFAPSMLKSDSEYNVFMRGNHPLIDIETTSTSGKNLLVIKDSYANSFVPFLTPYYSNITVVDPRYYFDSLSELVKKKSITDVLFLYNATTFFSDESLEDALLS